jgi:hypothetical protein
MTLNCVALPNKALHSTAVNSSAGILQENMIVVSILAEFKFQIRETDQRDILRNIPTTGERVMGWRMVGG